MTESTKAMNIDAKISAMTAALFNHDLEPEQALVLAATFIDNEKHIGKEKFIKKMDKGLRGAMITINGNTDRATGGVVVDGWLNVLLASELLVEEFDGNGEYYLRGPYLDQLDEVKVKYYPADATAGIERTRNYAPTKTSKLVRDAVHALERTEYHVDAFMLKVAGLVFKNKKCDEQYVLDGCDVLMAEGNVPRVSEFFGDSRLRLYQAACHGPNGQASDMGRALQDLSGVHTNYDVEKVIPVLLAEMDDMISSDLEELLGDVKEMGASQFIITCLDHPEECGVKKPWSFVKAANILLKLRAGKKPYIGMAFGLDAKCSGPQLGALMCADEEMAAACGFSYKKVMDAYQRAIKALAKVGFNVIEREVIKKAYMGIFYGQAAGAFTSVEAYDLTDANMVKLHNHINSGPCSNLEENGKLFHKIVEQSFGMMCKLRKAIKDMHYARDGDKVNFHTHCATSHYMPDGAVVKMNYKLHVDIFGDVITPNEDPCDVSIQSGMIDHTFKKLSFKTKTTSLMDYARTGFVNLIQATDALLARLIITHLDQDEGAQHIIAVHDCFRVNINDMIDGKLDRAIKASYLDIFTDKPCGYLRQGKDIIKLYFDGVNESRKLKGLVKSQFDVDGDRVLEDVNDECITDLINNLGEGGTYYFAK